MDTAVLRGRLERDRAETEGTLGAIRQRMEASQLETGGEISLNDQHPADAASETESREMDVTRGRMLEARLARVQAALARMDAGSYGRCVVCGERIPDERLEAVPDTAYCVRDARREERK